MADETTESRSANAGPTRVAREINASGGCIRLRMATDADAAFLFELFRATRGGPLRLGGLPEAMIDNLLTMQYRARNQGYGERFPEVRRLVVETADGPIGELIEHDEADAVYIVDIALLPDQQQRGIGTVLVRSVMEQATARGGVRAIVMVNNAASLKMFGRLGFRDTGNGDEAHVELRWHPLDEAKQP
jgi:ribosomal protein S18 acetylase RimI-like enzyme